MVDAKLKQSPALRAFMLRAECRDLLLNSQAAEHDFFLRVAKDVEIASVPGDGRSKFRQITGRASARNPCGGQYHGHHSNQHTLNR